MMAILARKWTIKLGALALLLVGSSAHSAGIINGSFESPYLGPKGSLFKNFSAGSTGIPGWTIRSGNVDVQKGYGLPAAHGLQYLDLHGNRPGAVSQVIDALAWNVYELTFAYGGVQNKDQTWSNSIGNTLFYDLYDGISGSILARGSVLIQRADIGNFKYLSLQAVATSTRLGVRFRSDGLGNDRYVGPIIDNVSLKVIGVMGAAVPEPLSISMAAIGLATVGFVMVSRRRRSMRSV